MGGPGAIAEVAFEAGTDPDTALAAWRAAITAALTALAWPVELHLRRHDDGRGHPGADLVFAAPPDDLYLATEINDWAIAAANLTVREGTPADPTPLLPAWRDAITAELQPRVAALRREAAARDLPVLADDDGLTLGHGRRALTWPARLPPDPEAVPWDSLGRVPIALVTGTNGKTTTARLLARIARKAGFTPGNTSTDGMSVAERPLEPGDWTGPAAARTVLRHPEVDLAVLEVARGGILRRGLAVDRCDAAAVLNVSADHLGEYGIHDLAAMARVKAVVGSIVAPHGRVVLGADSPPLVDLVAAHDLALLHADRDTIAETMLQLARAVGETPAGTTEAQRWLASARHLVDVLQWSPQRREPLGLAAAEIAANAEQEAQSLELIDRMLEQDPLDVTTHIRLLSLRGAVLQRSGRFEEARAIYRWFTPLLHLDTHIKLVQYIKIGQQVVGLGSETVRAPRLKLDGDERKRILGLYEKALATRPKLVSQRAAQ